MAQRACSSWWHQQNKESCEKPLLLRRRQQLSHLSGDQHQTAANLTRIGAPACCCLGAATVSYVGQDLGSASVAYDEEGCCSC